MSTPFGRLALTHVLSTGGDALVALVLAGSLFFSLDPADARWRIALYLLFTMAPFALVGPFVGPAMDRAPGGRRWMLIGSAGGRVLLAALMIGSAGSDSLLLFPLAFGLLVLAKSYAVAKAAVVPTVVTGDHALVEANSKLQLLSGLAAFAAGVPGALVLWAFSPAAVALLAALVFGAATAASLRVPVTTVAAEPEDEAERAELRSAGVLAAASAMGTLRWIVGFVTLLLAFALRGADTQPAPGSVAGRAIAQPGRVVDVEALVPAGAPPVWHFGVVVALTGVGGLLGASIAPRVRRLIEEELLLFCALVLVAMGGVAGVAFGGLPGQSMLALSVAMGAAAGKQAFDAVVQRDAPDANRGRAFARFESRFQVIWVIGAAVPVLIALPTRFGATVVAALAGGASVFYFVSNRAVQRGQRPPKLPGSEQVRDGSRRVAGEVRRRALRRYRPGMGDSGERDDLPPPGRTEQP